LASIRPPTASLRTRGLPNEGSVRWSHRRVSLSVVSPVRKFPTTRGVSSPSPSEGGVPPSPPESLADKLKAWWKTNQDKSKKVKEKLLSYGPAAVLAYGLFDGVSYSIAFAIAFLGYEAQTGLNPCANISDLVRICILMWAGNNVTRPFRLAGAAALAPFVDSVMEKLQNKLRLPNKLYSFFILTFLVASVCLSGVYLYPFPRPTRALTALTHSRNALVRQASAC
jgi:hypothetical protein